MALLAFFPIALTIVLMVAFNKPTKLVLPLAWLSASAIAFFFWGGEISSILSWTVFGARGTKSLLMMVLFIMPIDLCAGNQDIFKIKEKFGKQIVISVNTDTEGVMRSRMTTKVYGNVQMHIDKMKSGGGYIVSSSHNSHESVPVKNFMDIRDAVLNYKN